MCSIEYHVLYTGNVCHTENAVCCIQVCHTEYPVCSTQLLCTMHCVLMFCVIYFAIGQCVCLWVLFVCDSM